MTNDEILSRQTKDDKYYTAEDLRLNRKYGFLLSRHQMEDFLLYKDGLITPVVMPLSLKSWNSARLYYCRNQELSGSIGDYVSFFKDDIERNESIYVDRNIEEITIGIICSELEGTLKIEGINTTRRQIESIIRNGEIRDKNSRIIYNMYRGLKFIYQKPEFNKENLKTLYDLLSEECLNPEDELGENFYRNDTVYVGDYTGCPASEIESSMNSLFEFIGNSIKNEKKEIRDNLLVPFIAHYYLLYIHPYFDYNGRTARMVQIWIFLLMDGIPSLYLSEAVNDNKTSYYKAIENTRDTHNDLSYFLIYMIQLANSYYLVHKNLESVRNEIESKGDTIPPSELHYLKRIILNKNKGWFNYRTFMTFAGLDVTKQGALKILNSLEKKGLIESKINSSKEKIYLLKDEVLKYELK